MEGSSTNTLPNGYVMERKASAGSILVETEIVVREDNVNSLSHSQPPSVKSVCRSMSRTLVEGRPPDEPAEESDNGASQTRQVVSRLRFRQSVTGDHGYHNVIAYDGMDNGYRDLIQFLKKPPPPSNYMSLPDSFSSSSEDDKWHKLKHKVLRQQRKTRRHRPPTIRLPDSAVAATTIGGHRHIAISIPLQYSHLAALSAPQYPIYDSIEAAFQREVESRFGSWRASPSDRIVTVLNPVAEDRESLSSVPISPRASLVLQEHQTALSPPPKRARPHSVALLPSQEQRYNPDKPRDSAKRRSLPRIGRPMSLPLEPTGASQSGQETASQHASWPSTGTGPRTSRDSYRYIPRIDPIPSSQSSKRRSQPRADEGTNEKERPVRVEEASTSRHLVAREGSQDREVITTIPASHPGQPQIVLTLPSRTSSKRNRWKNFPADQRPNISITDQGEPVTSQRSSHSGNGSGNGSSGSNGHRPRGSVAESLMTTTSSPKLLKAQMATAYRPVPIVAHPPGTEVESPLDLNFPEPPPRQAARTLYVEAGLPPGTDTEERGRSRKARVREKKLRDVGKLKAKNEQEQTERRAFEPSETFEAGDPSKQPLESPILGSLSSTSGSRIASLPPTLGKKMKQPERRPYSMGTTPGMPPVFLRLTPRSSPSQPSSSSAWDHDSDRTSYRRRKERQAQREAREKRKAREMAKMMAEEPENLDRLSREEILRRYETLRETRIYETERRLRKLERNRDTWVRTVPMLLETLNTLLQEQQHLLRDARITYTVPTSAGPSQHRSRRARSLEPPSSPLPSRQSPHHTRDPLETRRPLSMQSSSESRSSRRSREASGLRGGQLAPQTKLGPLQNELDEEVKEQQIAANRQEQEKTRQGTHKSTEALTVTTPTEGDAGYYSNRSTDSIADAADQIEPLVRGLQEAARLAHAIRNS
ncbi:hypothetical protein F5Y18DRAFT_431117 [Xylariaceae sp. FL1019]|nr:hypothetical protein F5Y18DRAFT_431117 [Xylariaceae sp. FL1019]